MSFYDDASLVVIPSGYKTSKVYAEKPTDGSGDLAFTRTGDTATRVNSAGLIEKVRTNLITYSEQLNNAAWTKEQVTITANATTSPDGTITADKVIANATAGDKYVAQIFTVAIGDAFTTSAYFKSSEYTYAFIRFGGLVSNPYVIYNLATQSVVTTSGLTSSSITSVGNGWYRIAATVTSTTTTIAPVLMVIPSTGYTLGADNIPEFTGNGTSGGFIWGGQLELSDFGATAYIPTTTAAVSVGPVANVPRLDYLGSTCPRLLLEPQRTNLVTYSEQFNNAAWLNGQNSGAATITANQIISPDGYLDADKIAFPSVGAGGQYNLLFQPFTASATAYTASAYLRGENGGEVVWLSFTKDGVNYNRTQCTLTTAWQRFTLSATLTAGSDNFQIGVDTRDSSQSARPAQTIYAWGAQLEQGAYSTSLIPTLAASATRGADACSKTGISSLIGQTEGTIFYDGYFGREANEVYLFLQKESATGVDDSIYIQKDAGGSAINLNVWVGSTQQSIFGGGSFTVGQRIKVAAAYKANDFVMYINGTQIGTDNAGSVPTCGAMQLASYRALPTNAEYIAEEGVNQALLFKTRLTNAEMQELTTL